MSNERYWIFHALKAECERNAVKGNGLKTLLWLLENAPEYARMILIDKDKSNPLLYELLGLGD